MDFTKIGITVVAYSRPDHLKKLLFSLKVNKIKNFTVFIDGADDFFIRKQQQKIIKMLQMIDWADVKIINRPTNIGLRKSIISSLDDQFKIYDKVILLEDDCIPQMGFFDFMLQSLETFKDNKKIRSICGYQLPINLMNTNKIETIMSSRFIPWGWATWKDRWQDYEPNLTPIIDKLKVKDIINDLPSDLLHYLDHYSHKNIQNDIWSINWVLVHYLTKTYTIFPSTTLIENIGFDGTGVHSITTKAFKHLPNSDIPININIDNNINININIDRKIIEYMEKHWIKNMIKSS